MGPSKLGHLSINSSFWVAMKLGFSEYHPPLEAFWSRSPSLSELDPTVQVTGLHFKQVVWNALGHKPISFCLLKNNYQQPPLQTIVMSQGCFNHPNAAINYIIASESLMQVHKSQHCCDYIITHKVLLSLGCPTHTYISRIAAPGWLHIL